MTGAAPDVELILDVRDLRTPPGDRAEFAALWDLLEPALNGRDLSAKRVHELVGRDGTLRLEIARITAGTGIVTAGTRFAVVAVRERSKLYYRCKECADRGRAQYGPFVCSNSSEKQEHRVCDLHVSILDGSLVPTCGAHRPNCKACRAPAAFWCAGRSCGWKVAWCQGHRTPHPQDPDVAYCPSCYAAEFPPCEASECPAVGTVICEHVSRAMERCGRRMCTRHARRWQVFGGERLGLGRCSAHSRLTGLSAQETVFQIVVGAGMRRRPERLPSLAGFGHTLRLVGELELSVDYRAIFGMLKSFENHLSRPDAAAAGPTPARVRGAMLKAQPGWEKAAAAAPGNRQEGERLLAGLQQIVRELLPRDGAAIATAITLAEYKPPRPGRHGQPPAPGMLFVVVPEDYRGLFIGGKGSRMKEYESRLGVTVGIHGSKGRR